MDKFHDLDDLFDARLLDPIGLPQVESVAQLEQAEAKNSKQRKALSRMKIRDRKKDAAQSEEPTALVWVLTQLGISVRRAQDVEEVVDAHLPGLLSSDDLAGLLLRARAKRQGPDDKQLLLDLPERPMTSMTPGE